MVGNSKRKVCSKVRIFCCNHVNGFLLIIPSLSPTSEMLNYSDKKRVPSNVMEMFRSFPKNVIMPGFLGISQLNNCVIRSVVDVDSQQIEPLGIFPNTIQ